MDEITVKDLLEAIKVNDQNTLTRWHRAGLIPPPEIRTHPNGRGKLGYWPAWVLEKCKRICELRTQGKRLDEIKEILGTDFERDMRSYGPKPKRYNFAESFRQSRRSEAHQAIESQIQGIYRRFRDEVSRFFQGPSFILPDDFVDEAIGLMRKGYNPVAMIDAKLSVTLTVDYRVADFLAENRSISAAILVIPLQKELWKSCRDTEPIPQTPTIQPSLSVNASGRSRKKAGLWGGRSS